MTSFDSIAIPHRDILSGKLTMDVFAADLWEVFNNRGVDEYRDPDLFFKKTYMTEGLNNLLSVVEKRLKGTGGDPVIQVQTPFGGGKTHSMIALYHKAREWGANCVVISGTEFSADQTLWGVMERQLNKDKEVKMKDKTAPGKLALKELLKEHQPTLILMDEVLEYMTKASGVGVGESNLGSQTLAFFQELTETVSSLEKVSLVITLPSSLNEKYDEKSEKLYQQLQKISGRKEMIYTPVQDNEINHIIRKRLFSEVKEKRMKEVIDEFILHCEKENILPPNVEPSIYREEFMRSYPFLPEVVRTLYHRWGSFPTFQRTRGVLRLLSIVINLAMKERNSYISLSDFDLTEQTLKQELIKHIGNEYNSIIASDIIDPNSGSKKVDLNLGNTYKSLRLGTRTSTAIFMYSFSGGAEKGISLNELKRVSFMMDHPSSLIAETAELLKQQLFYLQYVDSRYAFSNQPNLNRVLLIKMDNVKDEDIIDLEKELITKSIRGSYFKVHPWFNKFDNVPDNEELKLIIYHNENKKAMEEIYNKKGQSSRVNRNTLTFLYPDDNERTVFNNDCKKKIAYEAILKDKNLQLSEDQRKEVQRELRNVLEKLPIQLRKMYRKYVLPSRVGLSEDQMGYPTIGTDYSLDKDLYEHLKGTNILERMAPMTIREKYLKDKDHVNTKALYQTSLSTPGELRYVDRSALEIGIKEGVRSKMFGLGEITEGIPHCIYYGNDCTLSFLDREMIIRKEICEAQQKPEPIPVPDGPNREPTKPTTWFEPTPGTKTEKESTQTPPTEIDGEKELILRFEIPKGQVSSLMGILNLLQSKFDRVNIEIKATEGFISRSDLEDKIKEAFRQAGIYLD